MEYQTELSIHNISELRTFTDGINQHLFAIDGDGKIVTEILLYAEDQSKQITVHQSDILGQRF